MISITNSTISNCVFKYNVEELTIQDATIDKCTFNNTINEATIKGSVSKCEFQGLYNGIEVNGTNNMLNDMTIQVDIQPNSASYVQDYNNPSQLVGIQSLKIDTTTVPRLAETLHKECFINVIKPDDKRTFIVQLATDDTNPSGIIMMFFPGEIPAGKTLDDVIPKGYIVCDGIQRNGFTPPDLSGRFIRMVGCDKTQGTPVYEQTGPKDNSDLQTLPAGDNTHQNDDGRQKYIVLQQYHLPVHQHSFNEITVDRTFSANGNTDSYTLSYTGYNISSGSDSISTGGDGTAYISTISYSTSTLQDTHSHSIDINVPINFSFTPTQKQAEEQNTFKSTPISVEPQAFALIFIMKL